jgi:hypothetical protein
MQQTVHVQHPSLYQTNSHNINQMVDFHLSSTHPSDPMLVPRARHRPRSQVLLKKSAANRLVELFGEETLQDAQPLASRGSTGYTMLQLVGGWPTPLKNDGVKVSWDDDILHIPNIWKVIKAMFQTTNQSIIFNMLQRSSRLQTANLFVACILNQLIQQPSCVP